MEWDLGCTVEEEIQALDTKPEEQKQRDTDWEEISASPGTLLGRKGKSSVCSQA